MSIYIKGMEMPTGSHEIIIRIQSDGRVLDQWGHRLNLEPTAVPVPEHGDLIDRDAIKFDWDEDGQTWGYDIYSAPTIIPASKEGEG